MNTEPSILSAELLKKVSGEFDLDSVTELNAKDLGITDLGVIADCKGLIFLDLSRNNISNLHNLVSLTSLTTLDLSCNRISSLAGLQGLESLKSLNIAGNVITSIDSLKPLEKLENLRSLRLKDHVRKLYNPVCQTLSNYKTSICSFLGKLTMLDGEKISGAGSEVFTMCDELEAKLNDCDKEEKIHDISNISRSLNKPNEKQYDVLSNSKNEPKVAWSAEQQFKDLLEQCRGLDQDAEKAVDDAKQALWGKEKNTLSGKK